MNNHNHHNVKFSVFVICPILDIRNKLKSQFNIPKMASTYIHIGFQYYSQLGGPSGLKFLASGMTKYDSDEQTHIYSDIQTHTIFGHTNSHIRTYKLTLYSDIQTHTPLAAPHGLLWARGGR